MCKWQGLEGDYCVEGLPHSTKEVRKPEPVGLEFKSVADGQSKVLMHIEPLEGAERQGLKKYTLRPAAVIAANPDPAYDALAANGQVYAPHTAITMRMTDAWSGQGKKITADSAFMSVNTLLAMASKGFYCQGPVKTAKTQFPSAHLSNWARTGGPGGGKVARGAHLVLTSKYTVAGVEKTMIAVGWMDKKLKMMLSSVGHTLAGHESVRKRNYLISNEEGEFITTTATEVVPRPYVVEQIFAYFAAVDIHDHLRQGSLQIERMWSTRTWWHRVWGTILGFNVTNMFLAYVHEYKMDATKLPKNMMNFDSFLDKLIHSMIFNELSGPRYVPNAVPGVQPPQVCIYAHISCNYVFPYFLTL